MLCVRYFHCVSSLIRASLGMPIFFCTHQGVITKMRQELARCVNENQWIDVAFVSHHRSAE